MSIRKTTLARDGDLEFSFQKILLAVRPPNPPGGGLGERFPMIN
jgi:hypothetical protein